MKCQTIEGRKKTCHDLSLLFSDKSALSPLSMLHIHISSLSFINPTHTYILSLLSTYAYVSPYIGCSTFYYSSTKYCLYSNMMHWNVCMPPCQTFDVHYTFILINCKCRLCIALSSLESNTSFKNCL